MKVYNLKKVETDSKITTIVGKTQVVVSKEMIKIKINNELF